MRVVITGCQGQLGRQLEVVFGGHEVLGVDLPAFDITMPGVVRQITDFKADLILHTAAFTDVDGCERDPERAFLVNAIGTKHVALAARALGAAMVHISTNEVFPGDRRDAYREWDRIDPISVYARSKAAGEQIVRELLERFYIVRIAWLFGPGGSNFVTKILAAARSSGTLRVAADEFGNPTYAPDLAEAVLKLVGTEHYGTYHFTNFGFCSRFEFAREILRCSQLSGTNVAPILCADWPRASQPPLHSVLANSAGAALGIVMRPWQHALAEYISEMGD